MRASAGRLELAPPITRSKDSRRSLKESVPFSCCSLHSRAACFPRCQEPERESISIDVDGWADSIELQHRQARRRASPRERGGFCVLVARCPTVCSVDSNIRAVVAELVRTRGRGRLLTHSSCTVAQGPGTNRNDLPGHHQFGAARPCDGARGAGPRRRAYRHHLRSRHHLRRARRPWQERPKGRRAVAHSTHVCDLVHFLDLVGPRVTVLALLGHPRPALYRERARVTGRREEAQRLRERAQWVRGTPKRLGRAGRGVRTCTGLATAREHRVKAISKLSLEQRCALGSRRPVCLWGAPRPGALRAPDYGARLRLAGPP